MEKIKKIFKAKSAKIVAILFIASLLALSFAPSINADGPIFNGLPGDQKLIRGANSTQNPGSANWTDPVNGKSGDAVAVLVYYHNIVEGTTAKNTRISVTLPQGEKTTQVLNAKLWANNADPIKDTLTINSNQTQSVEYIPGSTVWYPNRQGSPEGAGQPLADGITTPAGVSIGGIQGCWQYAGYVIFQVRLKHTPTPPPTNPNIALEKFVSKTSLGHGIYNWEKEISVNPNEEVIYRLAIHNDGTAPATGVVIKDVLPAGINYIPGSATLYTSTSTIPLSDTLFANGVEIPNIGKGESVYIIFRANVAGQNGACARLINTGIVTAIGGLFSQNNAIINVCSSANIIKLKSAWNITQSIDATKVPAKEGDVIEYHLVTQNIGNAIENNFVVIDDLSDVLDNAEIVSIGNNGRIEDANVVYPAINLAVGQTIDYTFKVKVLNQKAGSDLEMRNIYGNWVVIIIDKKVIIQNPYLTIEKLVRNVSKNETTFVKENSANKNDAVEYKILIKNTGEAEATDVKLRDVLPIPVSYLAGSITITLPNGQVITSVDLFKQDLLLSNLKPGESITAVFRATVNSEIACNSKIENKAITTAQGNLKANSFAYTNVVCEEVIIPKVKGISTLTSTGTPLETLAIVALVIMTIGSAIFVYKY